MESPFSSYTNHSHLPSATTDAGSPNSTQTSDYNDPESGENTSLNILRSQEGYNYLTDSYSNYATSSVSKATFNSADNYQGNSRYNSFTEMQRYGAGQVRDTSLLNAYAPVPLLDDWGKDQTLI